MYLFVHFFPKHTSIIQEETEIKHQLSRKLTEIGKNVSALVNSGKEQKSHLAHLLGE